MSKDIRSYFSPTSSAVIKKRSGCSLKSNFTKRPKRIFVDSSESDDDTTIQKSKKGKNATIKSPVKLEVQKTTSPKKESSGKKGSDTSTMRRKRMFLSSSSEEEDNVSVLAKCEKNEVKQSEAKKHFRPIKDVSEVFGNEPVKRSNSVLLNEAKQNIKVKQEVPPMSSLDDDIEFEAALLQVDEVGDNWTTSNPVVQKNENIEKLENDKKSPTDVMEKRKSRKTPMTVESEDSAYSSGSTHVSSSQETPSAPDSQDSGIGASPVIFHDDNATYNLVEKLKPKFIKSVSPLAIESNRSPRMSPKVFYSDRKDVGVNKADEHSTETVERRTLEPKKLAETEDYSVETQLWVEKYKPQSSSKIIGQQGDNSNVKKLKNWLTNWEKNHAGSKKVGYKVGAWNTDPAGTSFKAVLLSGPPGVGKTTSVSLVCKELGFDVVEFNASDTRSKRLLQGDVSSMLTCKSLNPHFLTHNNAGVTRNHVLVMDEVDGMAGNEDRGGIQELIQLIKQTKIPIICICNDRSHPKIRSLVNYCFDLRFSRPRLEQIKGFMMSICYKEKLNISSDDVGTIIASTNNDIRLTLNHLSLLAADEEKTRISTDKKNVKLGPWDVLRKVFSSQVHQNMTVNDKLDLFFYDYNIAPLFVFQNYLSVKPGSNDGKDKRKRAELFSLAADSLAKGEEIETCIRRHNNWSLLPVQAVFSSYIPGELLGGHCTSQITFPSWLGDNSKRSKMDRLLQELQTHTRLRTTGSKLAINLDYAAHIRNSILLPLIKDGTDGVEAALRTLLSYDLIKDDIENLNELCSWSAKDNLMSKINSKVKAAFTRTYNKTAPVCPYSLSVGVKKGGRSAVSPEEEAFGDDDENAIKSEEENDDDKDPMIIEKKKKPTSTVSSQNEKPKTKPKSSAQRKNRKKGS